MRPVTATTAHFTVRQQHLLNWILQVRCRLATLGHKDIRGQSSIQKVTRRSKLTSSWTKDKRESSLDAVLARNRDADYAKSKNSKLRDEVRKGDS